jgi:ADP-heptose:LPS heptosyltransferase
VRIYCDTGGLGDIVALTGAVREYRRAYPTENISVSTARRHDAVLRHNPYLRARPEGGRVVSLVMEEDGRRDGNLVREFCRQLRVPCIDDTPDRWYFPPGLGGRGHNPYIMVAAVDPTTAWPARRWPPERWSEVVRRLVEAGWFVYVVGARGMDRETPHISSHIRVRDVRNGTSVHEYAEIVQAADIFLGQDTGGFHVAAACRTPQVVLFSRSRSRGYWTTTALEPGKPCEGLCGLECIDPRPCVNEHRVEDVIEAVRLTVLRFGLLENKKEVECQPFK